MKKTVFFIKTKRSLLKCVLPVRRLRCVPLVLLICLVCFHSITAAAADVINGYMETEEAEELPEADRVMSGFIEEYLPADGYELTDGGEAIIIYAQTSGEEIKSVVYGELARDYGVSADFYVYKNSLSTYALFIDLCFDSDASITNADKVRFSFSMFYNLPSNTLTELWVKDSSFGQWEKGTELEIKSIFFDDSAISSSSYSDSYLSGEDISNNGSDRRVLMYIPNLSTGYFSSDILQVTWQQDLDALSQMTDRTGNGSGSELFRNIMIVVFLIVIDTAAVILVIRHIRKTRQTEKEPSAIPEQTVPEDMVNMKPEDIEYLKSIGYFTPKKVEK